LIDQAAELALNKEVVLRIQAWTGSSISQTLWIQGPSLAGMTSRYTLTSAYLVSTAQKANIPVLSYFCQHPGDRRRSSSGSESDGRTDNRVDDFTKMLYSLISQLLEFLSPGVVESELDFSSTRFASLSTTSEPSSTAISLLKDLLSTGPQLLFCIIDGLQFLAPETLEALWSLVDLLRGRQKDDRILKVLYTTDGFVEMLGKLENDNV
jgi:hypothetical protein